MLYGSIQNLEPANISFYFNKPFGHGFGAFLNFGSVALTGMLRMKSIQEIDGFASFDGLPTTDLSTILKLIFQWKFYYNKNSHSF